MRIPARVLLLCLVMAGCSGQPESAEGYAAAEALWQQSKDRPDYKAYDEKFVDSQNQQRLDDDSGCYQKGMGQRVVLIHLVDADGVIAKTVADSTNAKARCFVAAYTGAHMPKPPFSPFPVRLTIN